MIVMYILLGLFKMVHSCRSSTIRSHVFVTRLNEYIPTSLDLVKYG